MGKYRVIKVDKKTGKDVSGPLMPVTHQPEPQVKTKSIFDFMRKRSKKKKGY
jgi:hypothetical protein